MSSENELADSSQAMEVPMPHGGGGDFVNEHLTWQRASVRLPGHKPCSQFNGLWDQDGDGAISAEKRSQHRGCSPAAASEKCFACPRAVVSRKRLRPE